MSALRPALLALALALPGQGVPAQEAPAEVTRPAPVVLTLDQDRFFRDSAWGRAAIARAEAEGAELTAENRRIEEALQQEEQSLTDRRAAVPAEDFTRLAADFDTRVEGIRDAQEAKSRAIVGKLEAEQTAFFAAARPVLETLLEDSGASAILAGGAVILATEATDITATAVRHMDAAHPGLPPEAPESPAETPDTPAP
ncbi:OmpH family outer membrane protein [Rhodobacter sp. SGA-6-6]|uniref:OmpH family outer membrane protein n=1 Tax=Rhodobacter sp. SGA-6-6 TaxID=2710882 RepID=UPI0013EAF383|nr:OmpH family outer membrane protein [Rhodobacter sp. SGA-6-6]NGM46713.1 OmpH family outer membrane protein [Rhodobacter sp. SGA-6-6]